MAGSKANSLITREDVNIVLRTKHASERELWVSDNRVALGLANTLVDMYTTVAINTNADGEISSVQLTHFNGNTLEVFAPVPTWNVKSDLQTPVGNNHLLSTVLLGVAEDGQPADAPDEVHYIDVKIGRNTKSGSQMGLEGFVGICAPFKRQQHNFMDWKRDNRLYGFDYKNELKNKIKIVRNRFIEVYGDAQSNEKWEQMHDKITPLISNMFDRQYRDWANYIAQDDDTPPPITFVGASILFAINIDKPTLSTAKLIDPDHPILLEDEEMNPAPPITLMTARSFPGSNEEWLSFKQKWVRGFYGGFTNLVDYFGAIELTGELPKPVDILLQLEQY